MSAAKLYIFIHGILVKIYLNPEFLPVSLPYCNSYARILAKISTDINKIHLINNLVEMHQDFTSLGHVTKCVLSDCRIFASLNI